METLDNLKKTLDTSKAIKKVVETMKALSSANIKKYEKVVKILYSYKSNIELAIQGVLIYDEKIIIDDLNYVKQFKDKKDLIIVFGSNQGLCGRFNDRIAEFAVDDIAKKPDNRVIVVGDRLSMIMETSKLNIIKTLSMPNSIDTIANAIYEILQIIELEIKNESSNRVFLYYMSNDEAKNGTLTKTRLIPVDKRILENAKQKVWPTNVIPKWQIDSRTMLSDLLKQYVFIILNNAMVNSIASEQKNRLITLQNAENNISDLIKAKSLEYNQKRQGTITSELLDVVTGYQVSKKKAK